MINLDLTHIGQKIDWQSYEQKVAAIHDSIEKRNGLGHDFLGWTTWPHDYNREEVAQMMKDAQYVREHFEVLVVCGIGGSYLGARAAIEALCGLRPNDQLEIIYMGQTFSATYLHQVLDYLKHKRFAINVISKSGTTTETSISFRLLKELLEAQIGKIAAKKAIFATTDRVRGALKTLADQEGYQTYVLPDNIGGRYSVLTAVGLFPIACAGLDILQMLAGAAQAEVDFKRPLKDNPCYQYAVVRDYLYRSGKAVEMFVTYEPSLTQIGEWWKQLFGESEGKDKKGLLPASVTFSTDLHSMGQYIQDGTPLLFETVLYVDHPSVDVIIPHDEQDLDGLNYLEGKSLSFVNEKAFLGTLDAHATTGGVPNVVLRVDTLTSKSLGYLFYFFMRACAMSAYLLEINPFNQPGVEVYKKNMFHLLGKKGY